MPDLRSRCAAPVSVSASDESPSAEVGAKSFGTPGAAPPWHGARGVRSPDGGVCGGGVSTDQHCPVEARRTTGFRSTAGRGHFDRSKLPGVGAARSRDEFIAKLGTVNEEADEAVYWLEFIVNVQLADAARVDPLLDEARQLRAIFAKSCGTARQNHRANKRRKINR